MNDFDSYNDSYALNTPRTRSLFVTLLGGFYAIMCGLGTMTSVFALFTALLQFGSVDATEVVISLLLGLFNVALNAGLCYTAVSLIQRKNWARQVTLVLNYLALACIALGLLLLFGLALNGFSFGHGMFMGIVGLLFTFYVLMGAFHGYTIKRLGSFDVVNEFTAIEDIYQDTSHVPDVFS